MGLFDFILGTAFLGNVVQEAKSISDVQSSSEYQETVNLSTAEIQEYDDYTIGDFLPAQNGDSRPTLTILLSFFALDSLFCLLDLLKQ